MADGRLLGTPGRYRPFSDIRTAPKQPVTMAEADIESAREHCDATGTPRRRDNLTAVLVAVMVAGCVGRVGVQSDDTLTVDCMAHFSDGSGTEALSKASKAAVDHCAARGQKAQIIGEQVKKTALLLPVDGIVTFRCVASE